METRQQMEWRHEIETHKAARPPIPTILAFILSLGCGFGIWVGFPYPVICFLVSFTFFFGFNHHVINRRMVKLEEKHIQEMLAWDRNAKEQAARPAIELTEEDFL